MDNHGPRHGVRKSNFNKAPADLFSRAKHSLGSRSSQEIEPGSGLLFHIAVALLHSAAGYSTEGLYFRKLLDRNSTLARSFQPSTKLAYTSNQAADRMSLAKSMSR
ncbi:hypothetical protein XPA_005415 [Xanthoria parietina]